MSVQSVLTNLGNAIRSKTGKSGKMTLEQMVTAVNGISILDAPEIHPITISAKQTNTTVSLLTGNSFIAEHYADEGLLVCLVSLNNLSGVTNTIGAIYHGNRNTLTYSGSSSYGNFTYAVKSTYVTTLTAGNCNVPISDADNFTRTRLEVNASGDLKCYIPSDMSLADGSYVVALVLASA